MCLINISDQLTLGAFGASWMEIGKPNSRRHAKFACRVLPLLSTPLPYQHALEAQVAGSGARLAASDHGSSSCTCGRPICMSRRIEKRGFDVHIYIAALSTPAWRWSQ